MVILSNKLPIALIKQIIIKNARRIYKEAVNNDVMSIIRYTGRTPDDFWATPLYCTISIVENALTIDVFGAVVRVENLHCEVPAGEGIVDFALTLSQVDEQSVIGPHSVRINGVELLNGDDIDKFEKQVHGMILTDWSNS